MNDRRVFRGLSITYTPRAECLDPTCHWSQPNGTSTRTLAKVHVKSTGHSVRVTVETVDTYDPAGGDL